MDKFYGQVAYDAYCENRGWKSVNGEPLPSFENQSSDLKEAWNAAANAVVLDFAEGHNISL